MDRFNIRPPPSIKEAAKSILQRRERSLYIDDDIKSLTAQAKSDPRTNVDQFIDKYIDRRNIGMAVVAFSIHRFPFNPIPPGVGLDRWVCQYLSIIKGNFNILREFIELADNINQLSELYMAVPDPQKHWEVMYRYALYNSHGNTFSDTAASDMEDLPLDDPKLMETIRIGLYVYDLQNLPGEILKDMAGNPIDPELLARVQRSFWQEEFETRAMNVIDLYDYGKLSDNREIRKTIDRLLREPILVDTLPFQRLVKWQRLAITVCKADIGDIRTKYSLFRILQVDKLHHLGVQGLAACLPSYGDSYELQFIFELCSLNSLIDSFFINHDFEREGAWFDGWFERFPVSGSIDHVHFGLEYSLKPNDWDERFFEREGDFVKDARAIGLDDEDMEFLWGMGPQVPDEPPHLDIVDEVLTCMLSQIDVIDIRAWS